MSGSTFLDDSCDLLARTPRIVRDLLAGLPETWLGTPDTEGGWRPRDVVGHLISAERADWIPRIELILREGSSRPFDPFDRFAHVERDRGVALQELISQFEKLRTSSLERLAELDLAEADLERRGRHPQHGEVTIRELIATWAVHDLDHLAQVHAGLAGSHESAVGPWKANLGILLRRDTVTATA